MTEYVILFVADPAGPEQQWVEGARLEARDARSAVAAYIKADGREPTATVPPSKFLAIPARSFRPVTVTSQTQTRLIFR